MLPVHSPTQTDSRAATSKKAHRRISQDIIMEALGATFSGRWIGRGGSILWPPTSPDLKPLDFLFWVCVENYFYVDKI
jgi:hypothetical protein